MCILCVVQKWSRRVATMLPWLVIPLIGLWALSQLLPPGFRFEVTSPRLACVIVLLVTLFWYEILMPQLSIWRTKRIARLRERKRFEAIEMQKLRKMATRRCRNCSTPYRDQNPGGGKFMCSYCGHVSKRPVLDIPGGSAGLGITNSGIIGDLVSKGGKILSDNTWICGHEWRENGGNWVSGSFAVKSSSSSSSHHWGKSRVGFFGNDDHCLTEKSYSGVFVSACKLVGSFFLCVKWLWRKIFRGNSSAEDDDTLDSDHNGMLSKKGENGVNFHETRVEKARRKAEERRQARLERELLEEEERKQREEVARLVEERRKLRDETIEAEKEHHDKSSVTQQNKDSSKRDAERKRSERRKEKEKDKGSSKSNSDVEDLDRKAAVKESEKKREYDRRNDNIERRLPKTTALDTVRHHSSTNSSSRGTGGRYLDRVKGSLLSSSKAFNGAILFGKSTQTSGNVVHKTTNPNGSADHVQASSTRRKAVLELPPKNVPRSWGQLFTRAPAVPVTSYANAISQPNQLPQPVARGKQLPSQASPKNHFDNQIHFGGLSAPLNLPPIPNVSTSHTSVLHSVGPPQDFLPEEQEFFGDPCYVPDPVSLLGPVSESLDNFPLDLGTGFLTDKEFGKPYSLKNVSVSAEVTRPSPIESPMSRLRVVEERHNNISCQSQSTPKSQDFNSSPLKESSKAHEPGTWQMWSSPPLVQDGLGLVGGPASWLLPIGQNKSLPGEVIHPSLHKDMMSQHAKENQVLPGTCSPQRVSIGNSQIGGAFNPLGPGLMENDPWLQKNVFNQSLSNGENNFPPLIPGEDYARNEKTTYGSPARSTTRDQYELSPANCWSK